MSLIELGPVAFKTLSPALAPALLRDGPCVGRWVNVPGTAGECWERVGPPGGHGTDSQTWARYDRLLDGSFLFSGVEATSWDLMPGIRAAEADGHTWGESYGA